MRAVALLIVFALPGLAAADGSESATAAVKLQCESQTPGGDALDVKCPLSASGETQRFRFKVDYSGGHDDTSASLTATLNEQPLVCEEGSKVELMGEEGEVSLLCNFSIKGTAGTKQVLAVKLKWSHAQYTGFELDSV